MARREEFGRVQESKTNQSTRGIFPPYSLPLFPPLTPLTSTHQNPHTNNPKDPLQPPTPFKIPTNPQSIPQQTNLQSMPAPSIPSGLDGNPIPDMSLVAQDPNAPLDNLFLNDDSLDFMWGQIDHGFESMIESFPDSWPL